MFQSSGCLVENVHRRCWLVVGLTLVECKLLCSMWHGCCFPWHQVIETLDHDLLNGPHGLGGCDGVVAVSHLNDWHKKGHGIGVKDNGREVEIKTQS